MVDAGTNRVAMCVMRTVTVPANSARNAEMNIGGNATAPEPGGPQLLGQRRELDAAAQPLLLVPDDRDRHARCAHFAGEGHGLVEPGPGDGAGGDLLGEDPGDARRVQRAG